MLVQAKHLMFICNWCVLTEAGYVGEDVESILTRLLKLQMIKGKKRHYFIDETIKLLEK